MHSDLPARDLDDELERNAFNAAFNELGLRWHWCSDVYGELLRERPDAAARIRHYLETVDVDTALADRPVQVS